MSKKRLARDEVLQKRSRAEELEAMQQEAGEARRVQFLLNKCRLTGGSKSAMLNVARRRTGRPRLTLALFNELVPNFPVLMNYVSGGPLAKLHLSSAASLPSLFKKFQDAPFVKAYADDHDSALELANGRAIGLLFPRKGIVQGLIIHDGTGLDIFWQRGAIMCYHGGTREKPTRLYVQAFGGLVEDIVAGENGWAPELAI